MAKGNLLLGTAGNSVGDVVMYRREGAQVSRVRVRKIKNPKTDAQSLQRAAFSPVAKFYSPLAVVLERSFEGLSKMKSYNKFLKTNIDLARANGWLLPKGTGFFPLPYKLSQGTLQSVVYTISSEDGLSINVPATGAGVTDLGKISTGFLNLGYKAGDIVTIIAITGNDSDGYVPNAAQFEIDGTSETTAAVAFPGWTLSGNNTSTLDMRFSAVNGKNVIAGAIIVARFENDKWRRSPQALSVIDSIMTAIAAADYKAAAVASYGMNAGDPNPLVYLDGDTLEG